MINVSGLSHRGFFKAFNKHVGVSPKALLEQMRIERAKELILTCEMSIPHIARQCGYNKENSFWVAFRRTTGMAPKEFQRNHGELK